MVRDGRLDLPLPGGGATPRRFARLADLGRDNLCVARLAEAHVDAVAILAESGRTAASGAVYGVWAARPGGAGARLIRSESSFVLDGTVRFCSGARLVDRALVVADDPDGGGPRLVDVPVAAPGVQPVPGTWRASAMAGTDTLTVRFDRVPVAEMVGGPGWYVDRPGFAVGGAGVAAVWWGGAAGLLDRAVVHLAGSSDGHRLAHLGELDALLAAADALLARTAREIDADPLGDHVVAAGRVRSAVERVVREVLDRVPRMLGPGPLSEDPHLTEMLADLGVYVRQHHGERDHAGLGAAVPAARAVRA